MTGGESVYQSLELLVRSWDQIQVRHGGRTVHLSEIDDSDVVCRQVLRFLASRHLRETAEGPDEVPGP